MTKDQALDIVGTIFLVPFYYDNWQIGITSSFTLLFFLVGFFIPKLIDIIYGRRIFLGIGVIFCLIYWATYNVGGIFWVQTILRVVGVVGLGALVSPHWGNDRDDQSKD